MTTRSVHARAALDDGLAHLQSEIRQLASLVDVALERALRSLDALDQDLANAVIAEDAVVDELRFRIEDRAVNLIATQQPLAGDLRFVVAGLIVAAELERMGDYAAGIARVVQLHERAQLLRPVDVLLEMGQIARETLRAVIDAFIRRDEALAREVAMRDDEIDRLYRGMYQVLIDHMVADPRTIDRATWLMWVAHNLERVGDRIQNISERTIFEVTGVIYDRPMPAGGNVVMESTRTEGVLRARADLDRELAKLRRGIGELAERCDVALARSIDSLARLDAELAETVISEDGGTNAVRYDVERQVVEIMATQQPIARDLRFCIAALIVAGELERIGDYAAGIAQVTLLHGGQALLKPLVDIPRMASLVREMLGDGIRAFLAGDAPRAERVGAADHEVDRLYDQVYRELLTYVLADRSHLERATWLLWVAHDLERVGDRIQNICERTIYETTGVMREFSSADA